MPSHILIDPIYIKISNIRRMRADMKHKNGHNSGPAAWHPQCHGYPPAATLARCACRRTDPC